MENTLDRMVERIYQEGIGRAEERAAAIIADAQKQAAELLDRARNEAAQIVSNATVEATAVRRSTQAELSGMAQRTLSQLKHDIRSLLVQRAAGEPLKHALSDVQFIKDLFLRLAANAPAEAFIVTVPAMMRAEIADQLAAALQAKLPGLEIRGGERKSGFVVAAAGGGYEIEFSEASLIEFLAPYMKKATAQLFAAQNG